MHRLLRFLMTGVFLAGCWLSAQDLPATAVEGESWLNHLARDFNETSMGKTGRLGPSAESGNIIQPPDSRLVPALMAPQSVTLHGSDLYRLNCQGCHGESGIGVPPEINSVINPVRSTSVVLVMDRMKKSGADISPAVAMEMAQQSKRALLQRLHQGGQDMPPFSHLSESEIHALTAYLNQLAGVPGAGRQQVTLTESRVRVGEHIAKSTCHICHAATGADPGPEQILDGAIPPLGTLTARKSLPEFVRKVTQGAPVLMGKPALLCRGRMPVFGYLSEDEAEDVYIYLTLHQPQASAAAAASLSSVEPTPPSGISLDSHIPIGISRPNTESVSIVRFAIFPSILFLFLGGVVVKCMPLAVRGHVDQESCGPWDDLISRHSTGSSVGNPGKVLLSARSDSPESDAVRRDSHSAPLADVCVGSNR